jgi:hypothetical protein
MKCEKCYGIPQNTEIQICQNLLSVWDVLLNCISSAAAVLALEGHGSHLSPINLCSSHEVIILIITHCL